MSYSLVLNAPPVDVVTKDVGENIFLQDLPDEYRVLAFYYPSAMKNEDLEGGLRSLGDLTGKNLLVNIGKLNDPLFDRIVKMFDIEKFPVVVVTAANDLAGAEDGTASAYVRIDNNRLLADPARTVKLLEEIYGLFLRGEVADAIAKAQKTQRSEILRAVAARIVDGLRHLANFIAERDIKVSIATGSFELVKSGN